MTISISEEVCSKNKLSVQDVLTILLLQSGVDIGELIKSLLKRDIIIKEELFNKYLVTQRWADVVSTIMLDSDKDKPDSDRIDKLALKLMAVFPKEKKAGTCHYFRGNRKDISLRLKKFFKLYGNKYTDEQLVTAAESYVKSFNGNYSYMRILKYFIWKAERKVDSDGSGFTDETSDLATWIENEGQNTSNDDWTTELK